MKFFFCCLSAILVFGSFFTSTAQVITDSSTVTVNKPGQAGNILIAPKTGRPALYLHLDPSFKDSLTVHNSSKPLTGITIAGNRLFINSQELKVYPTGAFGMMLHLNIGLNLISFHLVAPDSTKLDTSIKLVYIPARPAAETSTFRIEAISIYPHSDQELVTGDLLKVRVKAYPGSTVSFMNGTVPLTELPLGQTGGLRGIYQTNYLVRAQDTLSLQKLLFTLRSPQGKTVFAKSEERIGLNNAGFPLVGISHGNLPYLNFGLGTDRLGGAKLGYVDTLVRMKITGRSGDLYRVDLSEHQQAWIPQNFVNIMPRGTFFPSSNTANLNISADSTYDYLKMTLSDRLPYSSDLLVDPTRIEVNLYDATSNTNWVIQHLGTKTVRNVYTSQLEANLFRITIDLNKEQSWGYSVYYEGRSTLVIRIRHAPQYLDLHKLTIAVDAGHGGKNYGARSITGVYEKNLTLQIANTLKTQLEAAGAKVILTRDADLDISMYDRVKTMQTLHPDLLISIHANSTDDPEVNGNSTYYRYVGFKNLSLSIYQKVLELGLSDYGNIGRFNFGLSGPTEYPNALVETAFLSSPSDEAHLLDPVFQTQMAGKIVDGINLFLKNAGKKNLPVKGAGVKD